MGQRDVENSRNNPRNTTNRRTNSNTPSRNSSNRNTISPTDILTDQITVASTPAPSANRSSTPIAVNPYDYSKESLSSEMKEGKYGGRNIVDDEKFQQLLSLGYDEPTLRQKYLPKSEKALADEFGDMYWNSPLYAVPEKNPLDDQGIRTLIMQSVLAPYLQKTGSQFNESRAGIQNTQQQLMQQMDPRYQPYVQAMNNASYMAQDQSWLDSLNAMSVTPLLEQLNANLAAAAQAGTQTDEDAFLASLGLTGLGG